MSQSPEETLVVPESDGTVVDGRAAESQIRLAPVADVGTNATGVQGSSYGVWFFVRTVLVLAVVLALVWAFFVFLKRASGSTENSDPYLKKVASLTLSPGKFVYVVTLNSKGYLIGVSDNSVNLIAEIEDKELIDAMNLNAWRGRDRLISLLLWVSSELQLGRSNHPQRKKRVVVFPAAVWLSFCRISVPG